MMSTPREEVDSLSEVEQLGEMSSEVDELSLVQGSAMLEVCDVNYGADQPTVMQPVLGTIYQDQSGFSSKYQCGISNPKQSNIMLDIKL